MSRRKEKGKLSGTQGTGDILCPFFHAHGAKAIQCVDIYPGSRAVTVDYVSKEEKEFQEEIYCKAEYKKCWLYDTAMRLKWDED